MIIIPSWTVQTNPFYRPRPVSRLFRCRCGFLYDKIMRLVTR